MRADRYAGWASDEGQAIMRGERSLEDLRSVVAARDLDPAPVSGAQEALETVVNRYVERVR